jgi:aspartate aminotransferase-like enzyme
MTVNFRLPGPTPLPPPVVAALGREMIPHRGSEFRAIMHEALRMAREVHRTDGDILVWPASGSAGWEVAIVNLLSPGDPVLAVANGDFGDRYTQAARRLGLNVHSLEVPWGQPVLPGDLLGALNEHPEVKAVLLVHNETSTGVTNPLPDLARVARDHGALVVVDSVSGVGAIPLEMDAWGIDLVTSGSQKAWMCPPGLLIVAAGSRVWDAQKNSTYPRFFWDMADAREMARQGMTPTTSPISLIFAWHAALTMIINEGVRAVWERHANLGSIARSILQDGGMALLAEPGYESNSVTAVRTPDGVRSADMLKVLESDFGVVAQAGQGHLRDSILRIGHMGWAHAPDVREASLAVVETARRLEGAPQPVPI